MYKIDKKLAPQYLIDLVPRNVNTHNYSTRTANNFGNFRCNLTIKQNTFFPKITSIFNELLISIKNSKSIVFKKQCKAKLLLEQENIV